MKKNLTVALLLGCMVLAVMTGCGKRCVCVTHRGGTDSSTHSNYQPARSIENVSGKQSCADLDREWIAENDTTAQMLTKKCVDE